MGYLTVYKLLNLKQLTNAELSRIASTILKHVQSNPDLCYPLWYTYDKEVYYEKILEILRTLGSD